MWVIYLSLQSRLGKLPQRGQQCRVVTSIKSLGHRGPGRRCLWDAAALRVSGGAEQLRCKAPPCAWCQSRRLGRLPWNRLKAEQPGPLADNRPYQRAQESFNNNKKRKEVLKERLSPTEDEAGPSNRL